MTLRLENVAVRLGEREAVLGASLTVKPGEVVGLIGPNGAGKTTLMRSALGLTPLSDGRVTIDDIELSTITPRERAKKIAYLPQRAPIHWPLTVENLVTLGRTPHLNPWQQTQPDDIRAVYEALEATNTLHLKDRNATTLSGGELARVLFARMLAVGAPYLLLDEPAASLDPQHQLAIMDLMRGQAQQGAGVLVSLHDLTMAHNHCDRLVLMHEGRIVSVGKPDAVLSDANLEAVFSIKVKRFSDSGSVMIMPQAHKDTGRPV